MNKRKESRNAFSNEREEEEFQQNYERIFKVRFPRMDTVDNVKTTRFVCFRIGQRYASTKTI
ncbi:MAG: hypothetical protein GY795_41720 [Desulfobacterales bacterium]|nr:hypothetical protein [Desulfobacterales bacterium]